MEILNQSPDVNRTLSELHKKALNGELEQLDNLAWINAYAQTYQSTHGSVLLISEDINSTICDVKYSEVVTPVDYLRSSCWTRVRSIRYVQTQKGIIIVPTTNATPTYRGICQNASEWIVDGKRLKYGLSESIPRHCRLQYSLPFAVLVTVSNFIKAMIMVYVAFSTNDCPLMTMGDAVASIIEVPDETTKDQCLLSKKAVRARITICGPIAFSSERQRWKFAATGRRWMLCLIS